MAGSAYNANEIFAKELEDELMKYTRSDVQNKAEVRLVEKSQAVEKKTKEIQIYNDADVNITECTKFVRIEPTASKYQDTTESSSSFDDSDFGEDNDATTVADSEALSLLNGDPTTSQNFDSFHESFSSRRKKLTEHWRSYIQPLIWRCKWLELQIKKLDSQAEVYEKELQAYKKRRRTGIDDSDLTDGVKSIPFTNINCTSDILKRKRRRRIEQTTDLADYMSQHKLFAYYESKKAPLDGIFKRNETRNLVKATQIANAEIEFGLEDELLYARREDPDNSSEHLLWKIFSAQSHVSNLKSKLDKVMSQNAGIFGCLDDLSFSIPSSTSTPNTGNGREHTNEPENSISSHGDTFHDAMDNTGHARFAGVSKRVGDGGALDNPTVIKEEPDDSRSNYGHSGCQAKEPIVPKNKQPSHKLLPMTKLTAPSSSRKKRGRRKAAGRKNRRLSG